MLAAGGSSLPLSGRCQMSRESARFCRERKWEMYKFKQAAQKGGEQGRRERGDCDVPLWYVARRRATENAVSRLFEQPARR